ncbi:MAG: cytochrome b561 domain-containing protein [Pseudomonadota bacterium]
MDVLQWWLTPLSGSTTHAIAPWAAWHARCMVLGWAVLLPVGVLVARYFKVLPGQDWPRVVDHKAWWHGHRALQYAGVLVMLFGVYLAWGRATGGNPMARAHQYLGWTVVALGLGQILLAWGRGSKGGPTGQQMSGDHYDMTPWRIAFERLHKWGGYAALLLAVMVIVLGLAVADAPRWMWLALGLWWVALGIVVYALQVHGRCMDTYQAIWGPDTGTAASRLPPVGWGVHRYTATQWQEKLNKKSLENL